ncbi:MAG: PstS family phosphate ABC transporter substrate-binding protein [Spirochaetales bacterium]|nr:PstS family phosphate ABC transporter substrate-binding protein [Spirochaetales bacterium]
MRMPIRICVVILLGMLVCTCDGGKEKSDTESNHTISISGAWALYPLTVKWAEEYMKIKPNIRIEVSAGGAGKGMSDMLSDFVDIGMISREIFPVEVEKGAWYIPVAKDAVVGTINAKNPYIKEIQLHGATKEMLRKIWIEQSVTTWEALYGQQGNTVIHVYTRSDACGAAQIWAQFIGGNQDDLGGVGVYADPGLADAVIKDTLGIGFNNINYAYDPATGELAQGLAILPLDLNNSLKLESEENFYATRTELLNAINQGVYPSPPARNLFFACHGLPQKSYLVEFLRWILTDGQRYVLESGYITISAQELQKAVDSLR